MQGGKIVYEFYDKAMGRGTPHILMSVSKSVLGLLVGILVERGQLPGHSGNAMDTRGGEDCLRRCYCA